MIEREPAPRHQRVAVLAAVFLFHAALIVYLMLQHDRVTPIIAKNASIALVNLAAEKPAAAKPPPPALPAKVAETFKPITELSIPTDEPSDAPPGASGACAIADAVLAALLADDAARDAIRRAPPETRSVAGAIVMWNAAWNPATATAPDPLFLIRANIERSLAAAPPNCLDEPLIGPRLLPIPDAGGERTTFLVFGSGNWAWRALVMAPPESPVALPVQPVGTPAP